jgi:hypothetical protein
VRIRILSAIVALALTICAAAAPPPRGGSGPPGRGGPPPKTDKEESQQPEEPPSPPVVPQMTQPIGFAGRSPFPDAPNVRNIIERETLAVPDRWRIGWPRWDRYGRMTDDDPVLMNNAYGDSPYTLGHPLNPYDRNVLKGDYPIARDDIFFNATFISDTLFVYRKLPTPSGVSAGGPGKLPFFGDGDQLAVNQNFFLTMDLFKGNTAFRPVDWLIRVTPAYNINYLKLRENNNVNINTLVGDERDDDHFSLQETFFEYHLGDTSPFFDVAAIRIGRQLFVSDFRGFIFNDVTDGVRLLGNLQSNRIQYNLAFFNQNDKDTNSELNELDWRNQQLLIANMYIQDFVWMGYTTQFSFHWNHDQSNEHYDNNGVLVIPDLIGAVNLHNIDAYYLGWAGDGHIGRVNVNHAFYYVFGHDDGNPLAGRPVDIGAYMGALELSMDYDWLRPKLSFLYASGDSDPRDGKGGGFDGIFDNPFFAGGPSSFYQNLPVRLFNVNLVSAKSFYNDLAGAKAEGQANYTGPGTILLGGGFDAEITPRLRSSFNVNSLWFADTASLEHVLTQPGIDQHIGVEVNLFAQYRPLLNNNIIVTAGGSVFFPGDGFEDIYGSDETLFQGYVGLTLSY